jgi:Uncharacterized conserved protein
MKIFISYRRAEDNKSYIVGTIHDKLAEVFGKENVFRDALDIHTGTKWQEVLDREANSCKVMVVVIGPDWTNLKNADGQLRLFDPADVTRWEVETGLKRSRESKATLMPVYILGAPFPQKENLPPSLHELVDIQGLILRNHPDFESDFARLVREIRTLRGFMEDDIKIASYEPKTIRIEEGPFWMGSEPGEGIPDYEQPQCQISIPAFRIGKYPITNKQYEVFMKEKGISALKIGWPTQKIPEGREEHPVTGVTWYEARAYCQWLSGKTGRNYMLPNEAQWEKACRGGNRYFYPWGDELDPARSNHGEPKIAAVNKYFEQNDYGCYDLVGNVRQWTCSLWGNTPDAPDPKYAYPWDDDGRNNPDESSLVWRVVRGSSYEDEPVMLRCSARTGVFPESRGYPGSRYSFRVVMIEK